MSELLLLEYRRQIEAKKADVEGSLRTWEDIAIEQTADVIDEVRLADDRDLAITSKDRSTTLLRQLRAALVRLTDGTFGTCMECGNQISAARLRAVPWAAFCIHCQEAIDAGRQSEVLRDGFPDDLDKAA